MGDESEDTVREEGNGACGDGGGGDGSGDSRRRYFVSLIDEGIYKKGVFQRLRRRHKVSPLVFPVAAYRKGIQGTENTSRTPPPVECSLWFPGMSNQDDAWQLVSSL